MTDVKDSQLRNACEPIIATELGITIETRLVQPEKAPVLREMTESGMVMFLRLLQVESALVRRLGKIIW